MTSLAEYPDAVRQWLNSFENPDRHILDKLKSLAEFEVSKSEPTRYLDSNGMPISSVVSQLHTCLEDTTLGKMVAAMHRILVITMNGK